MSWISRKWKKSGERAPSTRSTIGIAVLASFAFPAVLILLERSFAPAPAAMPELSFSLKHEADESVDSSRVGETDHTYSVTIQNAGPALRSEDRAELMLLFRSRILEVGWDVDATRGSIVQQCEGNGENDLHHCYLSFSRLGRGGDFTVIIKSTEHLSHFPRLHFDNVPFKMKHCYSETDEGKLFCRGRSESATKQYKKPRGGFKVQQDCAQMS